MLCPFCGKERKNHKRCPKCHKVQRQKWRGVTALDYEKLFLPKEEINCILSGEVGTEKQSADKSASEPSKTIVSHIAANWVKGIKATKHEQNK